MRFRWQDGFETVEVSGSSYGNLSCTCGQKGCIHIKWTRQELLNDEVGKVLDLDRWQPAQAFEWAQWAYGDIESLYGKSEGLSEFDRKFLSDLNVCWNERRRDA